RSARRRAAAWSRSVALQCASLRGAIPVPQGRSRPRPPPIPPPGSLRLACASNPTSCRLITRGKGDPPRKEAPPSLNCELLAKLKLLRPVGGRHGDADRPPGGVHTDVAIDRPRYVLDRPATLGEGL